MKSDMPYAGVATPMVREIARETFGAAQLNDAHAWSQTIQSVWQDATYREERYCAIVLARMPAHRAHRTPAALPLFEEMIVTGAWWDYVDEIASHLIGELLERYPRPVRATLTKWSRGDDMWKRRGAILAQLGFKSATDARTLFAWIEPSLASNEFFLRKAIGWALREYSKHAPEVVSRYVDDHAKQLSPLSRREALKVIERASPR